MSLFISCVLCSQMYFVQTAFSGQNCSAEYVVSANGYPDNDCDQTGECDTSSGHAVQNVCRERESSDFVSPSLMWVFQADYDEPTCRDYAPRFFANPCYRCVEGARFDSAVYFDCANHLVSYYPNSLTCDGKPFYYTWIDEECPGRIPWFTNSYIRMFIWTNSSGF